MQTTVMSVFAWQRQRLPAVSDAAERWMAVTCTPTPAPTGSKRCTAVVEWDGVVWSWEFELEGC